MTNDDIDEDHIIFLFNDQSNKYYPENIPSNFKVHLSDTLYLEGKWEIAVLDFYSKEKISTVKKTKHELYIFCDVCMGVSLFHNEFSLLRRVFPTPNNTWNYVFSNPIFVPVKKTEIRDLEIHIFDESGEQASFLNQRLSCTLHIRKRKGKCQR